MKKNKIYLIIFGILTMYIFGCDFTPVEDPIDEDPDDNDYYMIYSGSESPSVIPQYPVYFFQNDERRPIFVYGNDGDNTHKISRISIENNYPREVAFNTWLDKEGWVEANNKYTLEISVSSGSLWNDEETWKIKAGTYGETFCQNTVTVKKIQDRELEINSYYYVRILGADKNILLTEYNVNPKSILNNIFEDANIEVDYPIAQRINQAQLLQLGSKDTYMDELLQFALTHTDLNANFYDTKFMTLIGLQDYYSNDPNPPNFAGVTIFAPETDEQDGTGAAIFVCPDRCSYSAWDDTQNKKSVVRTIAHEMGHYRGRFLTPVDEAVTYGDMITLTNEPHTFGHQGNHIFHCIMAYLSIETETEAIENQHFCEGHLQMLYNTSFKLED